MEYITRELERKFLKLNDFFKVILVTGARQVGKTTMLKHLADSDRTYVTMDNAMARELAESDPVLFFQTYKPPILIDEVQKAPELFEQIKVICDESDEKGLIWLTGSQQYKMMEPEESGYWSCIAFPQEKKPEWSLIPIWIFHLLPCRQDSVNFPKMTCFKCSITFGRAVCRRCRAWITSCGRNISTRILTLI